MQIRIDLISETDITEELYDILKQFDVSNVIINNDIDNPEVFI